MMTGYNKLVTSTKIFQFSIHIFYDAYNLCNLYKRKKTASFNVEMIKTLCKHLGIAFKSKDRKQVLVHKLTLIVEECSCTRSAEK